MIRAAIIGGARYTAGELLRLLINHPDIEIAWVNSPEYEGALVADVHQGLLGETYLRFTNDIDLEDVDIVFFCTPNGESRRFIAEHEIPEQVKIVDLSSDFRFAADDHDFVYGLPELNRKPIVRGAKHVANPGAVAMAIELSLLPIARAGLLPLTNIHSTALIGSTVAGTNLQQSLQFSALCSNASVYKPLRHQNLEEIMTTLRGLQPDFDSELLLVTLRGAFTRGVIAVTYFDTDLSLEAVRQLYEEAYADHNFTFISDRRPDLKDVINTNKCIIYIEKVDARLVITAVIDNLLKGSAGTAIHNMNLLFGLSERTGLCLKASAF